MCRELCGLISDQHRSACPVGLLMRQKPTGTVSLGKDQQTLGQYRMHHNTDDSLGDFSVTLPVVHGTDVIIPRTPVFLKYFPLKFFGG